MKKVAYLMLVIPLVLLLFSSSVDASRSYSINYVDAAGGDIELNVKLVYHSDIVNSGNSIPITVEVRDQYNVPVDGAIVTLYSYSNGFTYYRDMVTDVNGVASTEFSAHVEEERSFELRITVLKPGHRQVDTTFVVTVFPVQERPINTDMSIALSAVMMATFLSTEVGKYGAFKMLLFPLYTRLKKDEVLDHFVRGQIYGHIIAHPGENYNSIRNELKVTNGTLSHHLRTLEVQGFIKSRRDGIHTRFYPIDMKVPPGRGIRVSDLQYEILELIKKGKARTQVEIAKKLDVSQQCISYNLRLLNREGIIGIDSIGREKKYYLTET